MIPDKVKIGYKEYEVKKVDYEISLNGSVCYADIDHNEYVIRLNMKYKDIEQSLLHEILHGIDDMFLHNRLQEEQIEMLARGLYMVLLDNPKLLKVLKGEI